MSSSTKTAGLGPSWGEVIFAGLASMAVGALFGLAYVVVEPVPELKRTEEPPAQGLVYQPGTADAERGRAWLRKRQMFVEGGSVQLTEDELNLWVRDAAAGVETVKPGATGSGWLTPKEINFRIVGEQLQIAAPSTLSFFGLPRDVIVQARGRFAASEAGVRFVADEFYLGACPLHRLPGLDVAATRQILAACEVKPEVAEAWSKLGGARVEGEGLWLTMR